MKTKTLLAILFLINASFTHSTETNDFSAGTKSTHSVKNNDVYVMDAVFTAPDGEAYFFIGKFYHRYNTGSKNLGKRSLIANSSDGFNRLISDVDAALVHPVNKKGYIFKGNVYYRYNFNTKKIEKQGVIGVDGWKGLQGPIDAALVHPTNNSAYFFKKNKYYRYNFSKKKIDKTGVIGTDGWKGIPTYADAALIHSNGKAYFFKGDYYYRYDFNKKKMDKKAAIKSGWKGLFPHLDAANGGDIFVGISCFHWELKKKDGNLSNLGGLVDSNKTGYKRYKTGYQIYKGVPTHLDAVITHPKNKKIYFFKQGQYFRYDGSLRKVDKIGTIGHDGWKKVPAAVDGAFIHENGKIYFFKGTKYYRFNLDTHIVDKVALIKDGFEGVPDNIDAVRRGKYEVFFYKKSVEYVYDLSKRRIIKIHFVQNEFLNKNKG